MSAITQSPRYEGALTRRRRQGEEPAPLMVYEFTHDAAQQQDGDGAAGIETTSVDRVCGQKNATSIKNLIYGYFTDYQHHRRQGPEIPSVTT
jgi:hypothetical protein